MALVNDDEIEEVLGELLVDVGLLFSAGDGLIEAEIDLEGLVHRAVGDLRHRGAEGLEVVRLGLVGEDVAIYQEEDALFSPRLPQPPDDLEGGVGLAGAGGHDEQDAILAASDGIDGAIDGDELVVARRFAGAVVVVVLRGDGHLRGLEAFGGAVALPKLLRRGKLIERNFALHNAGCAGAVVFQEGIAIGTVSEGDIENLCVFERLRHARAESLVVVLGLQHGEREVGLVVEDVVGLFGLAAPDRFATHDDAAFGEIDLLTHLRHDIPLRAIRSDHSGSDVLGADVGLGEVFFVHPGGLAGNSYEAEASKRGMPPKARRFPSLRGG